MSTDVVTGAFSYTGRFVAGRLLAKGRRVRTLTNHPDASSPLAAQIGSGPLDFTDRARLVLALQGVDTLYNTYWVRSNLGEASYTAAVANTRILIAAAVEAGVRRLVHVSIANPTAADLPYYRGKAELEEVVKACGLSYAIVRPTLLFGHRDVLINNVTWFLRHLPVFAIPGNGAYRLQPVYVEDYADLIVELGGAAGNLVRDAAGPEIFTFCELVRTLRSAIGSRTALLHLPVDLAYLGSRATGLLVRDMVLTRYELRGLMADILVSQEPPTCSTQFSDWLRTHHDTLGRHWASEVNRHYRMGSGGGLKA